MCSESPADSNLGYESKRGKSREFSLGVLYVNEPVNNLIRGGNCNAINLQGYSRREYPNKMAWDDVQWRNLKANDNQMAGPILRLIRSNFFLFLSY